MGYTRGDGAALRCDSVVIRRCYSTDGWFRSGWKGYFDGVSVGSGDGPVYHIAFYLGQQPA
jgi:hypothetical protein